MRFLTINTVLVDICPTPDIVMQKRLSSRVYEKICFDQKKMLFAYFRKLFIFLLEKQTII